MKSILFKFLSMSFDFSRSLHQLDDDYVGQIKETVKHGFSGMFSGEKVNRSENRSVTHHLSRDLAGHFPASVDVARELTAFFDFTKAFSNKEEGNPFKHILSVGIGGSHLGPEVIYQALESRYNRQLPVTFISNIDPDNFLGAIHGLEPSSTLVIFASKSFTTEETLSNLDLIRNWFNDDELFFTNSLAVTSKCERALALGFRESNTLAFSKSIGGRFSLSSAIGLPIALAYGSEVFQEFLSGMSQVDLMIANEAGGFDAFIRHVIEYDLNLNRASLDTVAVLPYSHKLSRLPAYLQQLYMESLGKQVVSSEDAPAKSGLVIFGEPGTSSQHSFMQYLHQGSKVIPAEFILIKPQRDAYFEERLKLFLNGVAQADALALGNSLGNGKGSVKELTSRSIPGGRPSTLIILDTLDAQTIGILIAWYEHLVVALSFVWELNAFDQWGVELGKSLAKSLHNYQNEGLRSETKQLLTELGLTT